MVKVHPAFEDDVPQFSGKINEIFVEWVTDVRLWEAEHKDETKPRLGHASAGETPLNSRNRSSRHGLVRETKRTSLWTTSSRRSEIVATKTLLKRGVRRRWTTIYL